MGTFRRNLWNVEFSTFGRRRNGRALDPPLVSVYNNRNSIGNPYVAWQEQACRLLRILLLQLDGQHVGRVLGVRGEDMIPAMTTDYADVARWKSRRTWIPRYTHEGEEWLCPAEPFQVNSLLEKSGPGDPPVGRRFDAGFVTRHRFGELPRNAVLEPE